MEEKDSQELPGTMHNIANVPEDPKDPNTQEGLFEYKLHTEKDDQSIRIGNKLFKLFFLTKITK